MAPRSWLLPKAILNARRKREWTQLQLAQHLRVSQGTISFWEHGVETPSLEHQVRLVTLLPEIFACLAEQEAGLLARLYHLERTVSKCHCHTCGCTG